MEYEVNGKAFFENLAIWRSKGRAMAGFEFIRRASTYEVVVLDYGSQDRSYLPDSGPYSSWEKAFAAAGAALDKIDSED